MANIIKQLTIGNNNYPIQQRVYWGECATAAATAAKVITLTDNTGFDLSAGVMIVIKFSYTNTAANPTFNVATTGAKSVWYNTAAISTGNLAYAGTANRPMCFVYNGTQWVFTGWSYDSNTTYAWATAAPKMSGTAAVGTATKMAREDHVHPTDTTRAPLASPSLTGTPTAPTPAVGTNTTQIATTAFVKTEINTVLAASDAMIFKGTLGTGGTITTLPASHSIGDTYKVITAGTYAGQSCEVGDMIICITNGTTANNAHWTIVQTNSDGHVTGPAAATANHVAVFDGTTGKLIKDSGSTIADLATASHTHTTTIAASSAASEITLEHGTKYAITAGGDTFVFTTPPALVWESF